MKKNYVYSCKVLINSVEIPKKLVSQLTFRHSFVPQLSSCNIVLNNVDGVLCYKEAPWGTEATYAQLNKNLVATQSARNARIDLNLPLFKDNDLVCVFLKADDVWRWGFFGYVSSVGISDAADGSSTVTLGCESSLKSLRTSMFNYNNLLTPDNISDYINDRTIYDNGQVTNINNITSIYKSIDTSNKKLQDQICTLMFGEDSTGTATGVKSDVVGDTRFGGYFDVDTQVITAEADIQTITQTLSDYSTIGNDADLDAEIADQWSQGWGTTILYPQRTVIYVQISTNDAFEQLANFAVFSGPTISQAVYTYKLDELHKILKPWMYVCYTLPSGDVVFEPFTFGTVYGHSVTDLIRTEGSSYTNNGQGIVTFALSSLSLKYPGLSPGEAGSLLNFIPRIGTITTTSTTNAALAPSEDVLDKVFMQPILGAGAIANNNYNLVARHGIRLQEQDQFIGAVATPEIGRKLNELIISRAWAQVKSCSFNCVYTHDDNFLNRYVWVEKYNAYFMVTDLGWTLQGSELTSHYSTGYGLTYDNSGKLGTDYSINGVSNIRFLLGLPTMQISAPTTDEATKAKEGIGKETGS